MAIIVKDPLKILTIHPVENTKVFVQWELDQSQVGYGTFTFTLLRSGSPEGPFDQVATGLTGYSYEDTAPLLQGMSKDLFYKVTTTGYESPVRSIMNKMPKNKYLIWRKIVNEERVLLKKGNGIEVLVLKRKHWGPRCTVCYDPKTGMTIKKTCTSCYGTSFAGGFWPAIRTWGHIKPEVIGKDPTGATAIPEVQSPSGFLQCYPIVTRDDILIEPETNRRFEIIAVQDTEILRNRVHQDITISRLPTDHIIYKFGV